MEIEIAEEIEKYKKIGLSKKLKNHLINFLDLNKEEIVLIRMTLFPLRSIFIDNIRERYAKYLILTTERIIFIISRGYLYKEFFFYNKITDILVTRNWFVSGDFPVIVITTDKSRYEILFSTLFPYRKKIHEIINCIKRRNPVINVKIDSKYEENYFKEVFFTKIKFK